MVKRPSPERAATAALPDSGHSRGGDRAVGFDPKRSLTPSAVDRWGCPSLDLRVNSAAVWSWQEAQE
jgi:hypothetical protein